MGLLANGCNDRILEFTVNTCTHLPIAHILAMPSECPYLPMIHVFTEVVMMACLDHEWVLQEKRYIKVRGNKQYIFCIIRLPRYTIAM